MTTAFRLPLVAALLCGALLAAAAPAVAQDQFRRLRHVFRLGQDLTVDAQSEVREVIVVIGTVTIEGRVERDVHVWLGDARLGPTAVIDGSLIVVAGNATVARGATLARDLAVIGGTLDAPADFAPGGDHALVGAPALGRGARAVVPWVTRGLLWGRLIVPDLQWVRVIAGLSFVVAIALTLIFGQAVRASTDVVVHRPLRTFLAGVLVLIVTGPLLVIFAATVVGLVVLPVVLFALAVAWTIGKVGVARGIGHRIVAEGDPESRLTALRSVVIGSVLILLAYAVPVLGLVTWSLVSVFGLGAATIAVAAALRREYPRKPKPPKAPVTPEPGPAAADESGTTEDRPAGEPPAGSPPAWASSVADTAGRASAWEPPRAPLASTAPPGTLLAQPRAAFLERTAAFALDCVLVAIIDRLLDSRVDGMFFILLVTYHVAFWAWQATTLGGIVVGLRVVRTDGRRLQPVDALVRGLAGIFSVAVLGIGCLWMLYDAERQTWHDKAAGTYVVKVPREWPLEAT